MLEAGTLYRDTQSEEGTLYALLEMKNVSGKALREVRVRVALKDGSSVDYPYKNLNVQPGETFGRRQLIRIPVRNAEEFEMSFLSAEFSDGTVWNAEAPAARPQAGSFTAGPQGAPVFRPAPVMQPGPDPRFAAPARRPSGFPAFIPLIIAALAVILDILARYLQNGEFPASQLYCRLMTYAAAFVLPLLVLLAVRNRPGRLTITIYRAAWIFLGVQLAAAGLSLLFNSLCMDNYVWYPLSYAFTLIPGGQLLIDAVVMHAYVESTGLLILMILTDVLYIARTVVSLVLLGKAARLERRAQKAPEAPSHI